MSMDLMLADQFARFFQEADKDESGQLSIEEVVTAMRSAGFVGTDLEIKGKFLGLDTSRDGKISFEEYLASVGKQPESVLREARLRHMFRSYDKDGSGFLERSDLEATFAACGQDMSEEEVAKTLNLLDTDKDGKINYEEFLKYYSK